MSTITSIADTMPAIGGKTSIQIAVPFHDQPQTSSDAALEAAVHRVATMLYLRSHCTAPPEATDMGGGLFNVVV